MSSLILSVPNLNLKLGLVSRESISANKQKDMLLDVMKMQSSCDARMLL